MKHWPRIGLLIISAYSGVSSNALEPNSPKSNVLQLKKTAFDINYRTDLKIAESVTYSLNSNKLRDCFTRSNSFKPDPSLSVDDSAKMSDYQGSGYDRGHLVPAGDNKWNEQAMKESFYLSNITPQAGSLNRGIWKVLEDKVRAWASKATELWVASGPDTQSIQGYLGESHVAIPNAFYKVLVKKVGDQLSGIGFYLYQTSRGDLQSYSSSIQAIERTTGLSFFDQFTPAEQQKFKSNSDLKDFPLNASFNYLPCTTPHEWFTLF